MRLSAAEQLKLSRNQCQQQQSSSSVHQTPLTKILSPRSVWRFQTPRTDVLSSTIIEDTAAEEKAMKPSPENTSPVSRLNPGRPLDLCSNLTALHIADYEEKCSSPYNDRLITNKSEVTSDPIIKSQNERNRESNIGARIDSTWIMSSARNTVTDQDIASLCSQRDMASTMMQYSEDSFQPKIQDPMSALESRRISNQLARAQFLASTPTSNNQTQNVYFRNRFRARSESPQHAAIQNVARSTSVPTLETAL